MNWPVPPGPSSNENYACDIEKLLLKTQVSWTSSYITESINTTYSARSRWTKQQHSRKLYNNICFYFDVQIDLDTNRFPNCLKYNPLKNKLNDILDCYLLITGIFKEYQWLNVTAWRLKVWKCLSIENPKHTSTL